jgi:hypothetical protein
VITEDGLGGYGIGAAPVRTSDLSGVQARGRRGPLVTVAVWTGQHDGSLGSHRKDEERILTGDDLATRVAARVVRREVLKTHP